MNILSRKQPSMGRLITSWAPREPPWPSVSTRNITGQQGAGRNAKTGITLPGSAKKKTVWGTSEIQIHGFSQIHGALAHDVPRHSPGPSMVVSCSECSYYVQASIRRPCPASSDPCPSLPNVSRCREKCPRICT